ncbi:MAG TPA: hypothetical protein VK771_10210 [Acidimicrobiia bacterium]|nr:hypothetical protein [Acidimicrobiia bacterium]
MDPAESPHSAAGPVRTCIFCDRPVGSTEYLWPEWLCRRLTDNRHFWRAQRQEVHADSLLIAQMRHEVDLTVDCLCEQCTRGWMQRLDDDVSGFLISMIEGNHARLSPRQQRLLARWAAKTAVVTEYVYDDPVLTPRPVREYLRRVGVHPGTQVLVGRYDGADRLLAHERDLFRRTIDDTVYHLSQSTLVIGKVLIQVFADPWRENAPQPAEDTTSFLVPLVPTSSHKVVWPPDRAIDDANYRRVRRGST